MANAKPDATPAVVAHNHASPSWVRAALADGILPEETDPADAAQTIVREILAGETADDVLGSSDPVGAKDILDQPITIHGGRFVRSDYSEGVGVYAVADVTSHNTGERFKVTMGAANIVAQLFRLAELHAFPVDVKIVEAKRPTADGYRPQRLVRL